MSSDEGAPAPVMVDVRLTEADDPRLAGFVQATSFAVEEGLEWRVAEVERRERGDLFDDEETLSVFLETRRRGEGGEWFKSWPIFFERPRDPDLRSLEGLASFLSETIGGPLPERYDMATRWGPDSDWPDFEDLADTVIFDLLVAIRAATAEAAQAPIEAERFAGLLGNAYYLGRLVRDRELKSHRSVKNQRAAKVRGEEIRRKAETWHKPTIVWVQQLIDQMPPQRLSYSKLAMAIWENWESRPEKIGPTDAPDPSYFERTLLPRWEKAGLIRRPASQ